MASNVASGYVNVKGAGIVTDENITLLIKKTFEAYAPGTFTLRQLHDKFNGLGLRKNELNHDKISKV